MLLPPGDIEFLFSQEGCDTLFLAKFGCIAAYFFGCHLFTSPTCSVPLQLSTNLLKDIPHFKSLRTVSLRAAHVRIAGQRYLNHWQAEVNSAHLFHLVIRFLLMGADCGRT